MAAGPALRRSDAIGWIGWIGLIWAGSGWLNGDAAAYAAQGWAGDVTDRWTHVGYALIAVAAAPWAGPHLPLLLDGLGVAMAVAAAVGAGRGVEARGELAALGTIAVLLPWAPFAEVDLVWIAALVWATLGVRGAVAVGVSVSPVALLALPWVALRRCSLAPLLEGAATVLLLTVLSAGAWWIGERGVLRGPPLRPARTLAAWGTALPGLLVLCGLLQGGVAWWRSDRGREAVASGGGTGPERPGPERTGPGQEAPPGRTGPGLGGWVGVLALLPLALAPADVPAWLLAWIALACTIARRGPATLAGALIVGQLGLGILEVEQRAERVRSEARIVAHVAASLGPADALIAPWTWGARVSVAATGDPYGVIWRPPGGWLRDQQQRWSAAEPQRAAILPPGAGTGEPDVLGIHWSRLP